MCGSVMRSGRGDWRGNGGVHGRRKGRTVHGVGKHGTYLASRCMRGVVTMLALARIDRVMLGREKRGREWMLMEDEDGWIVRTDPSQDKQMPCGLDSPGKGGRKRESSWGVGRGDNCRVGGRGGRDGCGAQSGPRGRIPGTTHTTAGLGHLHTRHEIRAVRQRPARTTSGVASTLWCPLLSTAIQCPHPFPSADSLSFHSTRRYQGSMPRPYPFHLPPNLPSPSSSSLAHFANGHLPLPSSALIDRTCDSQRLDVTQSLLLSARAGRRHNDAELIGQWTLGQLRVRLCPAAPAACATDYH